MRTSRHRGRTMGRIGVAAVTAALAATVLTGSWSWHRSSEAGPPESTIGSTKEVAAAAAPLWRDDFDEPAGAPLDATRWTPDVGGLGWGEGELQAYTDSPTNVAYNGQGQLVITARAEPGAGGAGYTSARITTKGRLEFNHGRVEARIKLPRGTGVWPAFWTLGADEPWPAHGEIDILEAVNDMSHIQFNTHQPHVDGTDWEASHQSPRAKSGSYADGYHVYAIDWTEDRITWSIDGAAVATSTRAITPPNGRWVLDTAPQVLVLNIAVGGVAGKPAAKAFPAQMLVDWVQVLPNADTTVRKGPSPDGG